MKSVIVKFHCLLLFKTQLLIFLRIRRQSNQKIEIVENKISKNTKTIKKVK